MTSPSPLTVALDRWQTHPAAPLRPPAVAHTNGHLTVDTTVDGTLVQARPGGIHDLDADQPLTTDVDTLQALTGLYTAIGSLVDELDGELDGIDVHQAVQRAVHIEWVARLQDAA